MRAGYDKAKAAAESLNIKPGTYRTYEYDPDVNGREPSLTELQRICRKFKVSWIWVATGDGDPDHGVIDPRAEEAATKAKAIPQDKQGDAWDAVMGVLDSYAKRAG